MFEPDFLITCDSAFVDQNGKGNIIGMFEEINAPSFPATNPTFAVVARWKKDVAKISTIRFKIISSSNEVLVDSSDIRVSTDSTKKGIYNHIQIFNQVTFKSAGEHAIQVEVNGITAKTAPLMVNKV